MTKKITTLAAALALACSCSSASAPLAPAKTNEIEILELAPAAAASNAGPRPESPPGPRSERGHWYSDEAAAVEMARKEGRPLVIDFRAAWCAACNELEKHTFSDADVKRSFERFVLLTVDATDDNFVPTQILLEKYGIKGLPAVLLIDSRGTERHRISSFVPPAELRVQLDAVR